MPSAKPRSVTEADSVRVARSRKKLLRFASPVRLSTWASRLFSSLRAVNAPRDRTRALNSSKWMNIRTVMITATMPKFDAIAIRTRLPDCRNTSMKGTVTIAVRATAAPRRCMRQNTQPMTVMDMKKATWKRTSASP